MPKIAVEIRWDPQRGKISSVDPDPVHVYWGRGDTAEWTLDTGGDPEARIEEIQFEGSDPKGPFRVLGPKTGSGKKTWDGSRLKPRDGTFKYDVAVEGEGGEKHTLDPTVVKEENP